MARNARDGSHARLNGRIKNETIVVGLVIPAKCRAKPNCTAVLRKARPRSVLEGDAEGSRGVSSSVFLLSFSAGVWDVAFEVHFP